MSDSLITIATYINHPEADVARSALEAAGIDVLLQSDDCGGLRPHLWLGGIHLLVRAEDVERAREVLGSVAEIASGIKQVSDPS